VFGHFALTPWNIPDNKYVDTVVAFAQKGILFLWDLGYFKVQAFAHIAEAGAYFFKSPQSSDEHLMKQLLGVLTPVELASFLQTVKGNIIEKDIVIGAKRSGRGSAHRLPCSRDKCQ